MYPLVLGFLIKGVIIDCIGVFLRGRKASLTPAIFIVFLHFASGAGAEWTIGRYECLAILPKTCECTLFLIAKLLFF